MFNCHIPMENRSYEEIKNDMTAALVKMGQFDRMEKQLYEEWESFFKSEDQQVRKTFIEYFEEKFQDDNYFIVCFAEKCFAGLVDYAQKDNTIKDLTGEELDKKVLCLVYENLLGLDHIYRMLFCTRLFLALEKTDYVKRYIDLSLQYAKGNAKNTVMRGLIKVAQDADDLSIKFKIVSSVFDGECTDKNIIRNAIEICKIIKKKDPSFSVGNKSIEWLFRALLGLEEKIIKWHKDQEDKNKFVEQLHSLERKTEDLEKNLIKKLASQQQANEGFKNIQQEYKDSTQEIKRDLSSLTKKFGDLYKKCPRSELSNFEVRCLMAAGKHNEAKKAIIKIKNHPSYSKNQDKETKFDTDFQTLINDFFISPSKIIETNLDDVCHNFMAMLNEYNDKLQVTQDESLLNEYNDESQVTQDESLLNEYNDESQVTQDESLLNEYNDESQVTQGESLLNEYNDKPQVTQGESFTHELVHQLLCLYSFHFPNKGFLACAQHIIESTGHRSAPKIAEQISSINKLLEVEARRESENKQVLESLLAELNNELDNGEKNSNNNKKNKTKKNSKHPVTQIDKDSGIGAGKQAKGENHKSTKQKKEKNKGSLKPSKPQDGRDLIKKEQEDSEAGFMVVGKNGKLPKKSAYFQNDQVNDSCELPDSSKSAKKRSRKKKKNHSEDKDILGTTQNEKTSLNDVGLQEAEKKEVPKDSSTAQEKTVDELGISLGVATRDGSCDDNSSEDKKSSIGGSESCSLSTASPMTTTVDQNIQTESYPDNESKNTLETLDNANTLVASGHLSAALELIKGIDVSDNPELHGKVVDTIWEILSEQQDKKEANIELVKSCRQELNSKGGLSQNKDKKLMDFYSLGETQKSHRAETQKEESARYSHDPYASAPAPELQMPPQQIALQHQEFQYYSQEYPTQYNGVPHQPVYDASYGCYQPQYNNYNYGGYAEPYCSPQHVYNGQQSYQYQNTYPNNYCTDGCYTSDGASHHYAGPANSGYHNQHSIFAEERKKEQQEEDGVVIDSPKPTSEKELLSIDNPYDDDNDADILESITDAAKAIKFSAPDNMHPHLKEKIETIEKEAKKRCKVKSINFDIYTKPEVSSHEEEQSKKDLKQTPDSIVDLNLHPASDNSTFVGNTNIEKYCRCEEQQSIVPIVSLSGSGVIMGTAVSSLDNCACSS